MERAMKQMSATRKAIIPLCHALTTTPERGIAQKERDEWKSEPLFMRDIEQWSCWPHVCIWRCVWQALIDQEQRDYTKIEKLNNKGFPSTCVQQTIERRHIREKRTWKMRDKTGGKEEETGRKEESKGYEGRREEKPRQLTGQERQGLQQWCEVTGDTERQEQRWDEERQRSRGKVKDERRSEAKRIN